MTETQLAVESLDAQENATLLALPSGRWPGFDLDTAYRVAAAIDRRRQAAGDAPRGWKIGFTNRSLWPRYHVHQPIWGRVWASTLTLLECCTVG